MVIVRVVRTWRLKHACVRWQIWQSLSWKLRMRKPHYLAVAVDRVATLHLSLLCHHSKRKWSRLVQKRKYLCCFFSAFFLTSEIVNQIVERPFIRPAVCTHQHRANRWRDFRIFHSAHSTVCTNPNSSTRSSSVSENYIIADLCICCCCKDL